MIKVFPPIQSPLSDKINQKLLDQLYLHSKKSLIVLLILAVILTYFMSSYVPWYIIYPWFIAIQSIVVSRLYDVYDYLSHDCSDNYKKWHQKFAYKAVLSAVLWGMVPILFLKYTNNDIYLLIVVILLGLSAGASASLSADRQLSITYLSFLLLPMGYHVLTWGNISGVVSFFIIILYLLTLFNVTTIYGSAIIESYQVEEELTKAKSELNNLFQQTPVGVFYFDMNLRVLDCNTSLASILRSTKEEMIGLNLNELPDKRPLEMLKNTLTEGTQVYRGPYRSVKGVELWIEVKCSPLVDDEGIMIGGVGLLENKTKEKEALDELEYKARHDELTSLNNRRSFKEYMISLIKDPLHATHYSILFYLDLNRFKEINDSLGHTIGDEVLVQVAERLKKFSNGEYVLSRLGGDEFTIIVPFCTPEHNKAYKISEQMGDQIQKLFSEALTIGQLHLYIKSSIGIVIIEPGTTNMEELIRYADISMYQAKREGSHQFAYYNHEMDQQRKELFKLQHDLNRAITNGELELFFQPVVGIRDNRLMASEALLRWNHIEKGCLTPSEFIDLAIESGLIDDLGWFVIQSVCSQIGEWKKRGLYKIEYVSININARQLQRYHFIEDFFKILNQHGVKPSEIMLEITERSLIDNFEQTNGVIQELQSRGVKCAIDDFGIGYSSLSYLQKLAFSILKIDREFIKNIMSDHEDKFLVESIIMIAKRFNYKVVVEGIETEEQKQMIEQFDDRLNYQGYLFSPAVNARIFEERFLKSI